MEQFNPGICEVTEALITPFGGTASNAQNIVAIIAGVTLQQSIYSTSLSGTIYVVDKVGLLEGLPIRGEENLDLKLKSFDFDTEREIKARIFKISGVKSAPDGNGVGYTLHFISRLTFDANIKYFISAYRDQSASAAAKDVFKKYYSSIEEQDEISPNGGKVQQPTETKRYRITNDSRRALYIQNSDEKLRIIIPRLAPSEAMHFISKRAFSKKHASSTFRFFENFHGYYFVTDEWLHEKAQANPQNIKSLEYVKFSSLNPEDAGIQVRTIQTFENNRRVNVPEEMLSGAYKNSIFEIDLLRHTAKRYNYSYLQSDAQFIEQNKDNIKLSKVKTINDKFKTSSGKSASLKIDVHTEDFINKTFTDDNARRFMIIRDYTAKDSDSGLSKNETFYRQKAALSSMYESHLNSTQVTIGMQGRLDLSAGEIVNINVREMNAAGETGPNKQLSGKYLIQTVMHTIEGNILNTICQVSKYDWSDSGSDNSGSD